MGLRTDEGAQLVNRREALVGVVSLLGGPGQAIELPGSEAQGALMDAGASATRTTLRTDGYALAGDGGDALYKRVTHEPSHAGKMQTRDGAWWEIVGNTLTPEQFGATGDNATDDALALQACHDCLLARGGGTMLLGPKTYYLGSPVNIRATGSYYAQNAVVNVVGAGSRTILTRKMTAAGDAPDIDNEAQCYSRAALALFASNCVIEGISFLDCGVGLYMGQDPASVPLTNISINRISKLWAKNCGVGVIGFAPENIYYCGFEDWHITQCQYGIVLDWHSGSPADGTIANFNRNQWRNIRVSRSWVGLWSKAGGTNQFLGLHFEGNDNLLASNRYSAPTGLTGAINPPIALVHGNKSASNVHIGCMFEANGWDLYNAGYDSEFAGCIDLAKCTFVRAPRALVVERAKLWANSGIADVHGLLSTPLDNAMAVANVDVPSARLFSYGLSGAEIVSTGSDFGIQQKMSQGLRHSRMLDLGAFGAGETKYGVVVQAYDSDSHHSDSAGCIDCTVVGSGRAVNQGLVTKFSIYYRRIGRRVVSSWIDADSVVGGRATAEHAGDNLGRFNVSVSKGAEMKTIEMLIEAPEVALQRVVLFIDEKMTRDGDEI